MLSITFHAASAAAVVTTLGPVDCRSDIRSVGYTGMPAGMAIANLENRSARERTLGSNLCFSAICRRLCETMLR